MSKIVFSFSLMMRKGYGDFSLILKGPQARFGPLSKPSSVVSRASMSDRLKVSWLAFCSAANSITFGTELDAEDISAYVRVQAPDPVKLAGDLLNFILTRVVLAQSCSSSTVEAILILKIASAKVTSFEKIKIETLFWSIEIPCLASLFSSRRTLELSE